jgi:hypothetical protein
LAGIVSCANLIQALATLPEGHQQPTMSDAMIRKKDREAVQSWKMEQGVAFGRDGARRHS